MKSNARTLLAIGCTAFAVLFILALTGCTTGEVLASSGLAAAAALEAMLSRGVITQEEYEALHAALPSGLSDEVKIGGTAVAVKTLDALLGIYNKRRAAKRAAKQP